MMLEIKKENLLMSNIIQPHGSYEILPLLSKDKVRALARATEIPKIVVTTREASDIIMLGIGAFTPLTGFMDHDDWRSVCYDYALKSKPGVFWPIPITLSIDSDTHQKINGHKEIALQGLTGEILAIMQVQSTYKIDKEEECKEVFRTVDPRNPGVAKVFSQGEISISGPIEVISELSYPKEFSSIYIRPVETRKIFEEKGWKTIAALQLRNPMHNSHMYLGWIGLEVCDGLFIHQIIGKLKDDDIPAEVRVKAVDVLVQKYMNTPRIIQGGYPMEMRYAGPREALLHAVFRQNFGCTHIIIGRDHAGVGKYYGPFDAQNIFDEIPKDSLQIKPLKLDWTFYCYRCQSMASLKTCPHTEKDRLLLSGTELRRLLRENKEVPKEFSKPEVLEILRGYYKTIQ